MAKTEKSKTIGEIRANVESQLKDLDTTIEKAVGKVDRLTAQRAGLVALLEKVNRLDVETEVA